MQLLTCFAVLSAVAVASAQVFVDVGRSPGSGGSVFRFVPNNITASNGTVITFRFTGSPGNHTVTQSTFDDPCNPMAGGFDSGNVYIPPGFTATPPLFNLTVTDDTQPIWFFCKDLRPIPHCQQEMVGAINAPTSGEYTLQAFAQSAMRASNPAGQGQGGLVGQGASAAALPAPISNGVSLAIGAPLSTSAGSSPSGTGASPSASTGASHTSGATSSTGSAPTPTTNAAAVMRGSPLVALAAVAFGIMLA
ncbi:hypothetical protein AX17_002789 [Amanita inopinata Kibby_2008]|nr:hypothetical protein AX17_002789 [Amanita inopinata Kibby_2008]